ncbi:MAG TPA: hypothetical protein VEK73_01440 [Xanthobacteraceae bacterium]|nr:hypothetical protein [Xanthobacteraceae bacterium]
MAKSKRIKRISAPQETVSAPVPADVTLGPRPKALVFVSHDSRDADLAEAFSDLLSDVSAGTLKSFRSSDKKGTSGIEFGQEWYSAIMSQLDEATDVVALLTQQSMDRPWILYEAGVAKGKLDTKVLGLALGVPLERLSTGPFAQFQNCEGDEDSLTKLVMQLLQRNPDAAPREEAVRMQVQIFLGKIEKLLNAKGRAGKSLVVAAPEEQSIAKLFEEVKAMVQELPERVDDRVRMASRRGSNRFRRMRPMMLEEIFMHPRFRESPDGPALSLLILLSAFRDDIPWMYEAGLELFRATRSQKGIDEALRQFRELFEVTMRSPLSRELLRPEDEETFMLMRHLPDLVEHVMRALPVKRPRTRLKDL